MGNGMNKILPGLYIGSLRDAKDGAQLESNSITHILSIHDNAKPLMPDKEYLCIQASDHPDQDLTPYFSKCIDFIHKARINGGNVLVHCIAGVSRSVTVVVAYIMTVTSLGWRDALNSVRGARRGANPNFGFQRQLLAFQHDRLEQERRRLKGEMPPSPHDDKAECRHLLEIHQQWVLHGDGSSEDNMYSLPHRAYQNSEGTSRSSAKDGARRPAGSATEATGTPDCSLETTGPQGSDGTDRKDISALDKFFEVNDRFQRRRLDNDMKPQKASYPSSSHTTSTQKHSYTQLEHITPSTAQKPLAEDGVAAVVKASPVTVDELFASSQRR